MDQFREIGIEHGVVELVEGIRDIERVLKWVMASFTSYAWSKA